MAASFSNSFPLPFTKMHGLGNDFVMVKGEDLPQGVNLPALTALLCDRHFGIGADGLIAVMPTTDNRQFDLQFVYFNSDGSRAEMCGNGIRCFARFVVDQEIWPATAEDLNNGVSFRVETLAGLIRPTVNGDGTVTVDMGAPILEPARIPFEPGAAANPSTSLPLLNAPLAVLGKTVPVTPVSMGNPHCIVFQDDLAEALDPSVFGPALEVHPQWPAKTNVEFVTVKDRGTVDLTVWERGCGFTLACGTGACATAVAAILQGKTDSAVTVNLPGGPLHIRWEQGGSGHVLMSGPAETVFDGTVTVSEQALDKMAAKLGLAPVTT